MEDALLNIQNRRYLGNKYKLLDFIDNVVSQHCPDTSSFLDIFAGTGVVAYHFMDRMKVITNDTLYSNYLSHVAFMSSEDIEQNKIKDKIDFFNSLKTELISDNYVSDNFANTFFSKEDCKLIGVIRESIHNDFVNKKINHREMAILVTSLLYSMDRIANTCGHYDSFRKGVKYENKFRMFYLDLSKKAVFSNMFFNEDSNLLVKNSKLPFVDCVYCDPPYNSRNYCDLYHVLENIATWKKPKVSGEARKMDRSKLKSQYCSKTDATPAFKELVNSLNCKYILLSYNNTGEHANDRSNARLKDEDIMNILSNKGSVQVFSQKYKSFTTGKSNNNKNEERLFLCKVN